MMQPRHRVVKLISGGQSGADIAGLRAGRRLQLETGGFAPQGYRTARGADLSLASYGLIQLTGGDFRSQYPRRSMMNVDAADATIAIRLGGSVGTDKSIGYALTKKWHSVSTAVANDPRPPTSEPPTKYRPVLVVHSLDSEASVVMAIMVFVQRHRVRVLNVCGHREWPALHNFEGIIEDVIYRGLFPFSPASSSKRARVACTVPVRIAS